MAWAESRATTGPPPMPPPHAGLDDPFAVVDLLEELGKVGAAEQVAALLDRDLAGNADIDSLFFRDLLEALRESGADDQAAALVDRLPARGWFDQFSAAADHAERHRG
ncbi:hypothetical protein ACQEU6_06985 [Spirillospora sp. CA-108201]